jgi:ABC-type siderophore export system fused ATPase/permease subunit
MQANELEISLVRGSRPNRLLLLVVIFAAVAVFILERKHTYRAQSLNSIKDLGGRVFISHKRAEKSHMWKLLAPIMQPEDSVIYLQDTSITDAELKKIRHLKNPVYVDLRGTQVTTEGIQTLRASVPDLRIEWEPR